MTDLRFRKSYADTGLRRSWLQVKHALELRQRVDDAAAHLVAMAREHEARIAQTLGRSVENMTILEIGPGQGMERAQYFGLRNHVVGLDLDVIPVGLDIGAYGRMLTRNGIGRFAKTIGRRLILGSAQRDAWANALGVKKLPEPRIIHGDIASKPPAIGAFDVVMSWSVFEHVADPQRALENVISALRPGGAFYISLHLYTSYNGHHDIRAFTGCEGDLPLWGHLRSKTKHLFTSSAYLNKWRLADWRRLFVEKAPGHDEILEVYEIKERLGPLMTEELREVLRDYTDEELYTVNAVYRWRKP